MCTVMLTGPRSQLSQAKSRCSCLSAHSSFLLLSEALLCTLSLCICLLCRPCHLCRDRKSSHTEVNITIPAKGLYQRVYTGNLPGL